MTPSQRDLCWRGALATIPLAGVVWLSHIARTTPLALVGVVPCLGVVAAIVTPSLTAVIGQSIGSSLYFPGIKQPPKAPTSAADALIVAEEWEAAEICLLELARKYPHDIAVWDRLFKLAWTAFRDHDRAKSLHRSALLSAPGSDHRERLSHIYLIRSQPYWASADELDQETAAVRRRMDIAARSRSQRPRQ